MTTRRRLRASGLVAAAVLAVPGALPATAQSAPGLAISVPAVANFGSATVGATSVVGNLGPVRVSTSGGGLLGSAAWTATVTTSGFATGGGTASETVPRASVLYRSGAATATTGLGLSVCTPGQLATPVDLASARTAFSCSGVSVVTSTSLTWNPQIDVQLPTSAVVGAYSGTITHSVA